VITDAHIHLWRLARGDNLALDPAMTAIYRDLEPDELEPRLRAAGVDRIVVVQAAETLAETLFTVGLARKFPWIAGVIGWIDPSSPSVQEEVAALSWLPVVKGVRPVKDDNRSIAWMLDSRNKAGWKALGEFGMSLDLLVQNWRELPLAFEFARHTPGVSIILDHCGKPDIANGQFEPWAASISGLAALPHVSCKLSGLMNCAAPGASARDIEPYVRHVLASFGPRRVMWASDWPPLDLAADYARWWNLSQLLLAPLDERDRHEVMTHTAARVYRLSS
jgi:L-fuconolactonase